MIKHDTIEDKDQLLDEISVLFDTPQNLSTTWLLLTFISLFSIIMIFFPKIYLKNKIYDESKKIGYLEKKVFILKEENRVLKSKIEQLKFKNDILDSLF